VSEEAARSRACATPRLPPPAAAALALGETSSEDVWAFHGSDGEEAEAPLPPPPPPRAQQYFTALPPRARAPPPPPRAAEPEAEAEAEAEEAEESEGEGFEEDEDGLLPPISGRRCGSCNAHATPLWRNGPLGPKTLCNACGVRDNRRKGRIAAARARLRKPSASAPAAAPGSPPPPPPPRSAPAASPARAAPEPAARAPPRPPLSAAQRAAALRRRRFAAAPPASPPAARALARPPPPPAAAGPIPVPQFSEVSDYDELYPARFAPPPGRLRAPAGAARLWGGITAAPLYCCDGEDARWLAPGASAAAPGAGLSERQYERLVDLFELASWEAGGLVTCEEAVNTVLALHGDHTPSWAAEAAAAAAGRAPPPAPPPPPPPPPAPGAPAAAAVAAAHARWLLRRGPGPVGLLGTRLSLPPLALRIRPDIADATEMQMHAFVFNTAAVARQAAARARAAAVRRGSGGERGAPRGDRRKRRRAEAEVWAAPSRRKRVRLAGAAAASAAAAAAERAARGAGGEAAAEAWRRHAARVAARAPPRPAALDRRLSAPAPIIRVLPGAPRRITPPVTGVTRPRSATPRRPRLLSAVRPLFKPRAVWGRKGPGAVSALSRAAAAAAMAAELAAARRGEAAAATALAAAAAAAAAAAPAGGAGGGLAAGFLRRFF